MFVEFSYLYDKVGNSMYRNRYVTENIMNYTVDIIGNFISKETDYRSRVFV